MNRNRLDPDAAIGCFALVVWLVSLLLVLAFWGLVAYGVWEGIQYLQRH